MADESHTVCRTVDQRLVLCCLHCGSRTALQLPVDLFALPEMMGAFAKVHAECLPRPERPICGDCLEPGHTADEHRARKLSRPEEWLTSGDTGISSKAIYRQMMNQPPDQDWGAWPPSDHHDFGRCYRLLERIPSWRARLDEMRAYPGWAGLVDAWEELEALYREEVQRPFGYALKLNRRMNEIKKAGRDVA